MCGKTQATASGKPSANLHGYLIGSPSGPHIASNVWGKIARTGSGMYENQDNLIKIAENFDASPAVTTGRPRDP